MTAERIEAPRDVAEAAALLTEASAREECVGMRGGGTEMSVGYPPEPFDVLLRTTLLDRIVDYAPEDLVVEVEAGRTLAALQAELAPHGQRLALDPPQPADATIGGLLATNTFGPRRARFGTLRDLIVGISLVRADGERVRGGGKVVKNVAGFDLPKIAVGSLGTLGLIATATFRLHPLAEATQSVRVDACDAAAVRALVRTIAANQIEPAALVATFDRASSGYDLYVAFEGFPSGVSEQVERFVAAARALDAPAREAGPDAPFAIDRDARTQGDVRLRVAMPPAAFETLHRDAIEPFFRSVDRALLAAYPSLGIAFLSGFVRDEHALIATILAMRRNCEAIGGNLVTLALESATLAEQIDPYGTLPAAFPLMRRLKDRFDPTHRLNRGRFIGKL